MSALTGILATGNINIGDHITRKIFGLPVELDIVWSTLIAGIIVLALGLYVSRKATSGVPGKAQLFFETVVDQVDQLVESTVGPTGRKYIEVERSSRSRVRSMMAHQWVSSHSALA